MLIKKKGDAITFYINGVSVFQRKSERLLGVLSGFYVGGKIKVEIDHIKITYPRKGISYIRPGKK